MRITKLLLLTLSLCLMHSSAIAGVATYYGDYNIGRRMANGQRFSQSSNSVATNRYRLGTRIKICHKKRCVTGVVRDRCNCSYDLSKALFRQLAPLKKGRIPVKVYRY
jgi:rare lipoprotein A (peptidoglycan hydrolase)